jgi:ActR/RegA family two-component response regulator
MKTEEKIYTQHAENSEWMNKLKFYKDEISILGNRLGEIASKNNHAEVLTQVEHFQNQFIIQKNNIDEIAHAIGQHEKALEKEIEKNPTAIEHRKFEFHDRQKEQVTSFEKNFSTIRSEFNQFSAKWM